MQIHRPLFIATALSIAVIIAAVILNVQSSAVVSGNVGKIAITNLQASTETKAAVIDGIIDAEYESFDNLLADSPGILDSCLESDVFDDNVAVFIADPTGRIITGNNLSHDLLTGSYIYDDFVEGQLMNHTEAKNILLNLSQGMGGSYSLNQEEVEYVCYEPLASGDYFVFMMADETTVIDTFVQNRDEFMDAIDTLIFALLLTSGFIIIFLLATALISQKRANQKVEEKQAEVDDEKAIREAAEKREKDLATDHMMLAEALQRTNTLCILVNLSRNEYHLLEHDTFMASKHFFGWDYDELIQETAATIPDEDQSKKFVDTLNHDALLNAYQHGDKTVRVRVQMTGNDGVLRWIDNHVLFFEGDNGDIMEVTLTFDVDESVKRRIALADAAAAAEKYSNIANVLSKDYEVLFYVNLEDNSYSTFGEPKTQILSNIKNPPEDFFEFAHELFSQNVAKRDRRIVEESFKKEALLADVEKKGVQYLICRFNTESLPCYYSLRSAYSDPQKKTHLVIELRDVDEATRKEREIELMNEELDWARVKNSTSQMQPHFLYNALASIREVILNDPEYASELIVDFTTHLRACVRSMSNDNLVPFSEELENIKAYVNIEKMRFGKKLNVEYDIQETDFDIVPLSIQPLVENAIRHGIYERDDQCGLVTVRTYRNENRRCIEVKDNGIGFNEAEMLREIALGKRDSTGIQNLRFRLDKMMSGTITFNSAIGKGTTATVSIPIAKHSNQQ